MISKKEILLSYVCTYISLLWQGIQEICFLCKPTEGYGIIGKIESILLYGRRVFIIAYYYSVGRKRDAGYSVSHSDTRKGDILFHELFSDIRKECNWYTEFYSDIRKGAILSHELLSDIQEVEIGCCELSSAIKENLFFVQERCSSFWYLIDIARRAIVLSCIPQLFLVKKTNLYNENKTFRCEIAPQ